MQHLQKALRITAVAIFLAACLMAAGPTMGQETLLCQRINAKQMPDNFSVPVMKFIGPAGDGRRGSAGFVVPTKVGGGTRLSFTFQRAASGFGFQIIHPFNTGHALVSVHSRGVTLHRGGTWGKIGWGDPATSDKLECVSTDRVISSHGKQLPVVSELTAQGKYELTIDGNVICRHTLASAQPLVLEVPKEQRVWGGSSWDRSPFSGPAFQSKLQPGHAGLILGPMDGSGPSQNLQSIRLTQLATSQSNQASSIPPSSDFDTLFRAIDEAREFGKLIRSRQAGGSGGGAFQETMQEPTLLVGFDYTLSRFYGGHLTVKSVRPLYQTRQGLKLGEWRGGPHGKVHRVLAKSGYVATSVILKNGHRLDGMRLLFMQVRKGRLNPEDAYRSEWIGGHGGGRERIYASYGDPIVSIFGRQGRDVDALGFVQVPLR